jgi:hypothetical protein
MVQVQMAVRVALVSLALLAVLQLTTAVVAVAERVRDQRRAGLAAAVRVGLVLLLAVQTELPIQAVAAAVEL